MESKGLGSTSFWGLRNFLCPAPVTRRIIDDEALNLYHFVFCLLIVAFDLADTSCVLNMCHINLITPHRVLSGSVVGQ